MKMKKLIIPAFALFVSAALSASSIYNITDKVKIEEPKRFGVNFETAAFAPWVPQNWNCWNNMYAFEPIVFRHIIQASDGGTNFIESKLGEPTGAHSMSKTRSRGTGFWGLYPDDFWNGAEARIYRYNGKKLEFLRKAKVKKFYGNNDGEDKIYFEKNGAKIEKGDVCDLFMERLAPPLDSLKQHPGVKKRPERFEHLRKYFGDFWPVTETKFRKGTRVPGLDSILDDKTFAPEGGSTASLKITFPGSDGEAVGFGGQYMNVKLGNDFPKGKTFRFEAWMKNKDLDGPVVLQLGNYASKEFTLTNIWKKYSIEFKAEGQKANGEPLMVGSKAKGTIWLDNLLVYQTDLKPFQIYPQVIEDLKKLKPGCLRSLSGRGMLSLDAFLSDGFTRNSIYQMKSGPATHQRCSGNYSLRQQLSICEEVGADPLIMTFLCWSDEEIERFMEYLAAPADVGYGKLRAKHGRINPWTEAFDNIYLECGNEIWNKNYAPQAFSQDPELCGQLTERLISKVKNSKWNTKKNIVGIAAARGMSGICQTRWDKNRKGWTRRSAEHTPSLDAVGSGPSGYIGGWDNASIKADSLEEALRNNLFFNVRMFEPVLPEFYDLRNAISNDFLMLQYEAGPGYPLPSPQKPYYEEVEQINKSLAMGIATLDNFMFVISNNGLINYYLYKKGNGWATHNHDGIPHTTYLAMLLRNLYAKGSIMVVKEGKQETIDLPEVKISRFGSQSPTMAKFAKTTKPAIKNVPLTRLYAFKEGKRNSFIILNRDFDNPQKVTINVPYNPESKYTEYLLTHKDPATTNRKGYNVKIQENNKTNFTKCFNYIIPPASAVTIVNYEKN